MYELISIPKRNTTAAGVTHFICSFLVLISHQTPAIIDGVGYDLPMQRTVYESYHRGDIPRWDPYTCGGACFSQGAGSFSEAV